MRGLHEMLSFEVRDELARRRLRAAPRRAAGAEEDAALSAFDSLCRGVELGRPMTNGIIMCGKTTTSRSGTMGRVS